MNLTSWRQPTIATSQGAFRRTTEQGGEILDMEQQPSNWDEEGAVHAIAPHAAEE